MPQISIKHHCLQTNVSTFGLQHWIYTCKFRCHLFHIIHSGASTAATATATVNRNKDKKNTTDWEKRLKRRQGRNGQIWGRKIACLNVCVCFFSFNFFWNGKLLHFFLRFLSYIRCSCALDIYLHGMVNWDAHRGIHLYKYMCMSHVNTQKVFCILHKKSWGKEKLLQIDLSHF